MENQIQQQVGRASISISINQGGFSYESSYVTIHDISFKEGISFLGKSLHKYLTVQRLMNSNSNNRPKLNQPFEIRIETSDGLSFGETTKIMLPTTLEKIDKFEAKLLAIIGISALKAADKDYYSNALLIKSNQNPNFDLAIVEQDDYRKEAFDESRFDDM